MTPERQGTLEKKSNYFDGEEAYINNEEERDFSFGNTSEKDQAIL